MRLLLTGDIHIGRSSTRVPEMIARDALRASTAWERIVDLAVEERVDVVCLSGDVTDKENKFWEAIGPLETGIGKLARAGIHTLAVSGNHDFDVFRRLADLLPSDSFRLLGRSGRWERHTFQRNGRSALHVDGWSFPRETVAQSPVSTYDLPADPTAPILGLVHGDLGSPGSRYAPLDAKRLTALPPNGWLLGHIHAPALTGEAPWILYPGSPQALDFGEVGCHGVWILDVGASLSVPVLRPLSTVRYDRMEIDVAGLKSEAEVGSRIVRGIRSAADQMTAESGSVLQGLVLRVRIVGRTPLAEAMPVITKDLNEDLALRAGSAQILVDRLEIDTLPDIDVEAYAKDHTAPGALARLLLALEEKRVPDDVVTLIGETQRALEENQDHKYYASLERADVTEEVARRHLRKEARALLTHLVAQRS